MGIQIKTLKKKITRKKYMRIWRLLLNYMVMSAIFIQVMKQLI